MGISRNVFFRGAGGSSENVEFSATVNEAVSEGHVLAFFTDGLFGQVRKARAATNQVVGVAQQNSAQGEQCNIVQHGLTKVFMNSAPAKADNGKPVYLSADTNGVASLSAPSASGSNVIKIGYLYGADGISVTPEVVLHFEFVVFIG